MVEKLELMLQNSNLELIDVWSLGCIIYTMIIRQTLFNGKDERSF